MFENGQKQNGLSLEPKLFMILLKYFFLKNMSVRSFFLGQLSGFSEDLNEVTLKLFYLLEVAFYISWNSLEIPKFGDWQRLFFFDLFGCPIFLLTLL